VLAVSADSLCWVITAQLSVAKWHDRIDHNAHRITLEGDSMRKQKSHPLTNAEISGTNPS
jgi:hypothetical protein